MKDLADFIQLVENRENVKSKNDQLSDVEEGESEDYDDNSSSSDEDYYDEP